MVVQLPAGNWLAAWRAHATLVRQAGPLFGAILQDMQHLVAGTTVVEVPYFTRVWTARRRVA